MLNGLEKYMIKTGIDFVTATYSLRRDNDSSIPIPDGEIFRFVLESKYELVPRADAENYTIVTSDKELQKYCEAFGIDFKYVEKPSPPEGLQEMALRLAEQLKTPKKT